MIDLKKNNTETNQNRGYFRPPFKQNFQNRPPTPPPEGLNIEEVANVLKALISAPDTHDDSNADDFPEEEFIEGNEEDDPDDLHTQNINHFWDLFEEQDEEVENVNVSQHPYNTRSQTNQGNNVTSNPNPDKNNANSKNSGTKEPITQLEYDIIDDLKKLKANISVFELLKIPCIQSQAIQSLTGNKVSKGKVVNAFDRSDNKGKFTSQTNKVISPKPSQVNDELIGKKSKSTTPPFLLTFEIFNMNVSNCMVDSGASTNVIPFSVAKKLNAEIQKSEIKIIQLDSSRVQVIGELRDVLIRLSANPVVHQIIDVIVVDIPEAYGLLLSRDWSKKLKGYFATDWSHLWLPHKGEANKIKVNREPYMKHTVTELNSPNEAVSGSNGPDGNYCIETFFGNFPAELSPLDNPTISANYLSSSELQQE